MEISPSEIESVLSVDVGSVNTRAVLFDLVGSSYRMLAASMVPSTHLAPIRDVQEGVISAIHHLEEITGRILLDANHKLILPTSLEGTGVDHILASSSAGLDIRIVTVGLLNEYSLANIDRLTGGTYARIVDRFSLNDPRKPEDRLNAFIQSEPDLVIIGGGTNHGAGRAVLRMVEQVHLAVRASQSTRRPEILYAGNETLKEKVDETLGKLTTVVTAPNVFPFSSSSDMGPVEEILTQVLNSIRAGRYKGFSELEKMTGQPIISTAGAESRIIRFQSLQQSSEKTVLGINIGSSASHFITANRGDVHTSVYGGLGVGEAMAETVDRLGLDAITRWLPMDIKSNSARDYIWQKSLFPSTIPMDGETLEIEQAVARAILAEMRRDYLGLPSACPDNFEPVLVSGAVIAQAPTFQQSLLMVLDGLQPTGVTTIFCDRYGLLSALGSAAVTNPTLVVQVLESGILTNLGTIISPMIKAAQGETVLHVRLSEDNGVNHEYDIRKGDIVRLPLELNKTARLSIKPLKRMDNFTGSRNLKVVGGELGLIIDMRGRPINLSSDPTVRLENSIRWTRSLQEVLS